MRHKGQLSAAVTIQKAKSKVNHIGQRRNMKEKLIHKRDRTTDYGLESMADAEAGNLSFTEVGNLSFTESVADLSFTENVNGASSAHISRTSSINSQRDITLQEVDISVKDGSKC